MRGVVILGLLLLLVSTVTASGVIVKSENLEVGYNNVGYYLYQNDNAKGAKELFRKAIETNPAYEHARYNLATLHFQLEEYDEAMTQLEYLLRLDASNPNYHYDLAINLIAKMRQHNSGWALFEDALNHYKEAEALEPGFAHAAENIAVLEAMPI